MTEKKKGKKMTLAPNCHFSTRLNHLMKQQLCQAYSSVGIFFFN